MRNRRLEVGIEDGELRICIGIDTLVFAAEQSPDQRLTMFDEDAEEFVCYNILDADEFARDVRNELLNEEEDGTTPVHTLLDNAMVSAIEEGSLAVAEDLIKSEHW